ncbi:uncharacterized protein J3R85_009975, partial [Psidium guajava]
ARAKPQAGLPSLCIEFISIDFDFLFLSRARVHQDMAVKPTVALRAILVGGIAAFAKIGGVMKAAGGVKLGAAAAAVTAAATAAVTSKQDQKDAPRQS